MRLVQRQKLTSPQGWGKVTTTRICGCSYERWSKQILRSGFHIHYTKKGCRSQPWAGDGSDSKTEPKRDKNTQSEQAIDATAHTSGYRQSEGPREFGQKFADNRLTSRPQQEQPAVRASPQRARGGVANLCGGMDFETSYSGQHNMKIEPGLPAEDSSCLR